MPVTRRSQASALPLIMPGLSGHASVTAPIPALKLRPSGRQCRPVPLTRLSVIAASQKSAKKAQVVDLEELQAYRKWKNLSVGIGATAACYLAAKTLTDTGALSVEAGHLVQSATRLLAAAAASQWVKSAVDYDALYDTAPLKQQQKQAEAKQRRQQNRLKWLKLAALALAAALVARN